MGVLIKSRDRMEQGLARGRPALAERLRSMILARACDLRRGRPRHALRGRGVQVASHVKSASLIGLYPWTHGSLYA